MSAISWLLCPSTTSWRTSDSRGLMPADAPRKSSAAHSCATLPGCSKLARHGILDDGDELVGRDVEGDGPLDTLVPGAGAEVRPEGAVDGDDGRDGVPKQMVELRVVAVVELDDVVEDDVRLSARGSVEGDFERTVGRFQDGAEPDSDDLLRRPDVDPHRLRALPHDPDHGGPGGRTATPRVGQLPSSESNRHKPPHASGPDVSSRQRVGLCLFATKRAEVVIRRAASSLLRGRPCSGAPWWPGFRQSAWSWPPWRHPGTG